MFVGKTLLVDTRLLTNFAPLPSKLFSFSSPDLMMSVPAHFSFFLLSLLGDVLPPVCQDMSENSGQQLLVKARFNFQQNNEDELTFSKGDIISVTRQEDGGWWEGMLNGRTGWFPSNYVREVKGSGRYLNCLCKNRL